jgi:hypothetical protein
MSWLLTTHFAVSLQSAMTKSLRHWGRDSKPFTVINVDSREWSLPWDDRLVGEWKENGELYPTPTEGSAASGGAIS